MRASTASHKRAAFLATTDSVNARYVVLDRLDNVSVYYLEPLLARRPAAFCLMGVLQQGTALFGINPNGAAAPDLGANVNPENVRFNTCDMTYWRSPEARRLLLGQ